MTDAPTLTPKHRERVVRAIEFLEQAQVRSHDAAEALSPVPGFSHEWELVRNLLAAVRERWIAVGSWLPDQDRG